MALSTIGESLARNEVLRAALEVFARKGVRKTRVEDLLQASGIARRTFYKRFRGKDDVLAQLYAFATKELIQQIDEARARSQDPLSGLRAALDTYLEFHLQNRVIAKLLIEEATRSESPLHPLRARFRRQLQRELADAFHELSGRALDPFVFVAVISGLEGISLELLRDEPAPEDIARARATVLGLVAAIAQSSEMFTA
ncbi:MAG: TetR/AcrR family transcriptional regulator [Myxococcota bacterium]